MNSDAETGSGQQCWWCGEPRFELTQICPACKLPNRLIGSLWTALRLLIIPLALLFVAYWFNESSKQSDVEREDRRTIAKGFRDLGEAFNDFRKARAEVDLACKAVDEITCYQNLKKSVIDLDHAFDSIGPRLAVFNEIFYRREKFGAEIDELTMNWHNCFIVPYHGVRKGFPSRHSYWRRILDVFENETTKDGRRLCEKSGCLPLAEAKVIGIVDELFSGTCVCRSPVEQRPLTWFLDEVQHLGFNVDLNKIEIEGGRPAGPVNKDILDGSWCRKDE
jgi:hypothetical protein